MILLILAARADVPTECETLSKRLLDPSGFEAEYATRDITLGRAAGQAITEAKAAAKQQLEDRYAATLPERERRRFLSAIKTLDTGIVRGGPLARRACAMAYVDRTLIDAWNAAAEKFDAELRAAVAALPPEIRTNVVFVEASRTEQGWSAGELGASFNARLQSVLDASQVPRASGNTATSVLLRASIDPIAPDRVHARIEIFYPDLRTSSLPDFDFNPWVLVDDAAAAVATLRDEGGLSGLVPGGVPRVGSTGLRAALTITAPGARTNNGTVEICAGRTFTLSVTSSAPARLQVWDIAPDGAATALLPAGGLPASAPGAPWVLPGWPTFVERPPDREHLVVAAVPSTFTATSGWGECTLPGGLTPEMFPAEAAFSAQALRVLAPGEGGCTGVAELAAEAEPLPGCRE